MLGGVSRHEESVVEALAAGPSRLLLLLRPGGATGAAVGGGDPLGLGCGVAWVR